MATAAFDINGLAQWIEETSGCRVNFEDRSGVTLAVPALRLHPRFLHHHGPTCAQRKIAGQQADCSRYKLTVLEKCRNGRPRDSRCPWGVWDAVHPVTVGDQLIGVCFIGGLRAGGGAAARDDLAATGAVREPDPVATPQRKAVARRQARLLAETIQLAVEAWQARGNTLGARKPAHVYVAAAEQFIADNHHRDISLAEFATLLKVHPKYLGPLIKAAGGRSFRELLLARRIQHAKLFLRQNRMSVTEIAYACGFNDGNYFSTAFRRAVGVTPLAYRAGGSKV